MNLSPGLRQDSQQLSVLANRRCSSCWTTHTAPDQVLPLLPGSASCFVIVTSRSAMTGLVARDGVHRIDLDLLAEQEAIALLRRLIGDRAPRRLRRAAATQWCQRLAAGYPWGFRLGQSTPWDPNS